MLSQPGQWLRPGVHADLKTTDRASSINHNLEAMLASAPTSSPVAAADGGLAAECACERTERSNEDHLVALYFRRASSSACWRDELPTRLLRRLRDRSTPVRLLRSGSHNAWRAGREIEAPVTWTMLRAISLRRGTWRGSLCRRMNETESSCVGGAVRNWASSSFTVRADWCHRDSCGEISWVGSR